MYFFQWLTVKKSLKALRNGDNLDEEVGQQDLTIVFLMSCGKYSTYEKGDIYFQDSAALF